MWQRDGPSVWPCAIALNRSSLRLWCAPALSCRFPCSGSTPITVGRRINAHLLRYCQHEHLTLTRSRPYQKNDQAYVEQKNWSIVRHLVGYGRYEGTAACEALERLHSLSPGARLPAGDR